MAAEADGGPPESPPRGDDASYDSSVEVHRMIARWRCAAGCRRAWRSGRLAPGSSVGEGDEWSAGSL